MLLQRAASTGIVGRIMAWRTDRNSSHELSIDSCVEFGPRILRRPASIAWQVATGLVYRCGASKEQWPGELCDKNGLHLVGPVFGGWLPRYMASTGPDSSLIYARDVCCAASPFLSHGQFLWIQSRQPTLSAFFFALVGYYAGELHCRTSPLSYVPVASQHGRWTTLYLWQLAYAGTLHERPVGWKWNVACEHG